EALLVKGQKGIIVRSGAKLVIKSSDNHFLSISDSVIITGTTGDDSFSLSVDNSGKRTRNYSGELLCKSDLGTLMLISTCDPESYIAGVVKAEGGSGRHPEYNKTQAVIARTYLYGNLNRHSLDGFDLCDAVHCQVFNGTTEDTLIIKATLETKGQVIIGPDSLPITAAFHSNCGGETLPSENLWLRGYSYLKKVKDPYCVSSRNSHWSKSIPVRDWIDYLKRSGMSSVPQDYTLLNFSQPVRMADYKAGRFSLPFVQIRTDLGLRSSFFSVKIKGDFVILSGRGYGHGAGLCQEGAMVMASKGYDYRKIIGFYYKGVTVKNFSTNEDKPELSDYEKNNRKVR
ncbi:MAG TPA: SpoIID/LytB domain-containing protein, partial [Bacteroidales bacterium]|nr:SpoIID/LytB domain-containing protein [Bacteroidales bacterium]